MSKFKPTFSMRSGDIILLADANSSTYMIIIGLFSIENSCGVCYLLFTEKFGLQLFLNGHIDDFNDWYYDILNKIDNDWLVVHFT